MRLDDECGELKSTAAAGSDPAGADRSRARGARPPTWVRDGGLTAFLFLLPLLVIFGAFSWYPIVRTVVMSFQHTNLVDPPTWVGLDNFSTVIHDPLIPKAVRNTAYFALLALSSAIPSRSSPPC